MSNREGNPTTEQQDPQKRVVGLARDDLAKRLKINPDEIELVSAEAVNWPDASLGNPQPGMMYAQVITPGYKIVLAAKGNRYQYHSSRQSVVFVKEL